MTMIHQASPQQVTFLPIQRRKFEKSKQSYGDYTTVEASCAHQERTEAQAVTYIQLPSPCFLKLLFHFLVFSVFFGKLVSNANTHKAEKGIYLHFQNWWDNNTAPDAMQPKVTLNSSNDHKACNYPQMYWLNIKPFWHMQELRSCMSISIKYTSKPVLIKTSQDSQICFVEMWLPEETVSCTCSFP